MRMCTHKTGACDDDTHVDLWSGHVHIMWLGWKYENMDFGYFIKTIFVCCTFEKIVQFKIIQLKYI